MTQVKPEKVILDLKISGDYSKIKVAEKIILAANYAVSTGTRIYNWQWGITWDKNKKYFRTSYIEDDFTYGTILAAVILFSNYKAEVPSEKTKVASEILGIEHEWIQGFINGIDGRYDSVVNEVTKRKSIKGQQCRDGIEIGRLLKFGYLVEDFVGSSYQPYTKDNFDTHKWIDIDENKILLSLGVNQKNKVVKCEKCNMYGCQYINSYSKNDVFFISKALDGVRYYRREEIFNCNCDEVIIKNILE